MGFDNVDADILCSSLRSQCVNHYLVSWVKSFQTGRSCRLLFQGSPRTFSPVSVGAPHRSPVSPLLFVINVASLHILLARGLVLSYIDDFHLQFLPLLTTTSVRKSPGPRQGPLGGLPRAPDGTGRQNAVHTRPSNLRTAVLMEDGGPYKVRHFSVGDCRGLPGTTGDCGGLPRTAGDCGGLPGTTGDCWGL